MLGTVDRAQVGALLAALGGGDGVALMQAAERIAAFAPDFASVLDELAQALHRAGTRAAADSRTGRDDGCRPARAAGGIGAAPIGTCGHRTAARCGDGHIGCATDRGCLVRAGGDASLARQQ
jgi:hypothetical protein